MMPSEPNMPTTSPYPKRSSEPALSPPSPLQLWHVTTDLLSRQRIRSSVFLREITPLIWAAEPD